MLLLFVAAPALAPQSAATTSETLILKGPGILAREKGMEAAASGRYAEAVPLLQRAVRDPPTATGRERQAAAATENVLGGALKALGKYDKAARAFARALSLLRGTGALLDEVVVESNLGAALATAGRVVEAEAHYHRALLALDGLDAVEDVDTLVSERQRAEGRADVLNNYADLRHESRRLEEAHFLHVSALSLREQTLGSHDAGLAGSLNNVAVLLMDLKRHEEALPMLHRAVDISRAGMGATHPQHATALANLAGALTSLRRPVEASPRYEQALAINTAALGAQHEATKSIARALKVCNAAREGGDGTRPVGAIGDG